MESEIVFTFYIVRSVRSPEIETKFEFIIVWFDFLVCYEGKTFYRIFVKLKKNHERYCKRNSYFTTTAVEYSKVSIENYNAMQTLNLAKYSSLCSSVSLKFLTCFFLFLLRLGDNLYLVIKMITEVRS